MAGRPPVHVPSPTRGSRAEPVEVNLAMPFEEHNYWRTTAEFPPAASGRLPLKRLISLARKPRYFCFLAGSR